MASGTLDADRISKEKSKWEGGNKVYTRRPKKGTQNAAVTTTSSATVAVAPPTTATPASPITTANDEQTLTTERANSQRQHTLSRVSEVSGDPSGQNPPLEAETILPPGNGAVRPVATLVDDRVRINLEASTSNDEIKELREKLKAELDQVRSLVQKLEEKEAELTNGSAVLGAAGNGDAYSLSQYPGNLILDKRSLLRVNSEMGTDYMDRRGLSGVHSGMASDNMIERRALMRVTSEVGSLANQDLRPYHRQLSMAVVDNNVRVGEFVEKEKRTPKANQYYRNSDFLLGKDRLPPESNKRLKPNGWRKHSRESDHSIGLEKHRNQLFKSCSNLLQRLMKHKHGWVFNEPVNAKLLGLHDYHDIIKHPMDLGTIKSRLAQNFYKSPSEFAEDVRLTFRNAMTYNPKGQDVHVMAEQLSNIFEERWAVIESEYNQNWRYRLVHDAGTPTPTSRKVHHFRTLDRSESVSLPLISRPKPSNFGPASRTPVPKKPKAKDPNKRNMTYEEKQKLSANLQNLPSEKLDNIVQIIKKSNTSLSQHNDEIEVDIDGVDVETLWELDRFVTNYKKSLSKHKRKAELARQARALAGNANQPMLENPETSVPEAPKENRADEKNLGTSPNQRGDNVSRSSSSSSSSSDSGSSSSDSDSDSSSADGSDAGHSPRS